MKQSTIEKLQNLAVSMQLVTVEDMQKHSIPQLVTMIANKMNELIQEVYRFEGDVSDVVKTQNDNIQYLLGEGLHLEVATVFENWMNDGTFDTLINQTALKQVNDRIDKTNAQLSQLIYSNYVNVVDFGADKTGVKDSTNAIRLAIASVERGVIYFPRGYYRLTDSVVLKSGITIKGEDRKSTFICPDLNVMGVTSSTLGVTPCFRTSGTADDISICDIGLDSLKFNDDSKVGGILFSTTYILNNFTAKNLYGLGQYQLLKFNRGDNYYFNNIHCDSSCKITPEPSENILSFAYNNNIIIENIICIDSVEIIDFSSCDTCIVNNVIGHSQFSDENEAIDIGGCSNITIENVKTYGYGEGVKLKQEGSTVTTNNITIKDCKFKDYSYAGIDFKTNYSIDDYVISNVKIINCEFDSNVSNSRGIYNISTSNNYGFKNVQIVGCKFTGQSYAIDVYCFKNLEILDNEFNGTFKYALINCEIKDTAKDNTKNGNVIIKRNRINAVGESSSSAIKLVNFDSYRVDDNSAKSNGVGRFLNSTNTVSAHIVSNEIYNYSEGIRYDVTNFTTITEVIDVIMKNNKIRECATSIRFSMDAGSSANAVDTIYQGLIINENDILNKSIKDVGILLRGVYVTNGFNNIQVMNNRIYNTTTPISKYSFVEGNNCKFENYIY